MSAWVFISILAHPRMGITSVGLSAVEMIGYR